LCEARLTKLNFSQWPCEGVHVWEPINRRPSCCQRGITFSSASWYNMWTN